MVKPAIRGALSVGQTETERRAAWQRDRGEDVDNPILLDTRTGEGYMTGQIRSTLHRYVQEIYSELESITPSVVRSSYATWRFQAYKQGIRGMFFYIYTVRKWGLSLQGKGGGE